MKRPLVFLTAFFCLGILFGAKANVVFIPVYILAIVLFLTAAILSKRKNVFYLLLAFLALFLGILRFKVAQIPPYLESDKYKYFKGFVANQPALRYGRTYFILRVNQMQDDFVKQRCNAEILVWLKGAQDISYGEEIVLNGVLQRSNKTEAMLVLKKARIVRRLSREKGFFLKRFSLRLRGRMESQIFKHTSSLCAGVLAAMALGEKRHIPALLNKMMVQCGTVHILVVSGFNVGVVVFTVMLLLKILHIPRKARILIAVFVIIIYCFITGASTPVLRATLMGIVFILAYLFKRQADVYNSCAFSMLFILLLDPKQLFDIGFQLSFASVISITCIYPRVRALMGLEQVKIRFLRFLGDSCLISLSAWLGTAGFIAYYFKIFSPVTLIANVIIVPLATVITLTGFSLILIGAFFPVLAGLFALSGEFSVFLLIQATSFLLKLPFSSILLH